jgi:phosphoglycolate phosphatase-like HAD superfamily hydrolase
MIRAVVFDVDGTLVDSVDSHATSWQDSFRHFGHEFDYEDIRSQIGKGGDQLMPMFLSEEEIEAKGEQIEASRSALVKEHFSEDYRLSSRPRIDGKLDQQEH